MGRGDVHTVLVDRIILKLILKKEDWRAWTRFTAQDWRSGELW
jgi:hypothetical protein